MKTYPTERIRNVVLIGHGHTGKTSLTEAMLFASGAINRVGRVEEGNTVSDFDPDEIARQISVNLSLAPLEWKDHKLNIIDTPGFADFFGDAEAAMRAADAAIIVVSAVDGVQVQARVAWDIAERMGLPRAIFINKLDRERADFRRTLDELADLFGTKIAPVHLPIGAEHDFAGVVDLLNEKEITYADGRRSNEGPLPEEHAAEIDKLHVQLVESGVEADDELMERYLAGEEIQPKEVIEGLHKAVASGSTVPVLCGAATSGVGVDLLLDFIVEEMPSPLDRAAVGGTKNGSEVELRPDPQGPLVAQVFKTLSDPYVGRLTYFRVFSGTLHPDSSLFNATKGIEERIGHIFVLRGKTQENVSEVLAGDIAAVAKLTETVTGDSISMKQDPIVLPAIEFPAPVYS
ncbi:MAG TPA: GTP-binding protein, partial [Actinomycetota bacterium]|nr:GTP-binding protein [Actinomycetota bacterium]